MIDQSLFYQEENKKLTANFATITGVYDDGLTIRIDGELTETKKHYKRNRDVNFNVGDRVKIFRDSGTIVVEYVIN